MHQNTPEQVKKNTQSFLVRSFGFIEDLFFGRKGPAAGPVFLIGLPRAGTTLLYQQLCHRYAFGYFPRIMNTITFIPSFLTFVLRRKINAYTSTFISSYGSTSTLASPGEMGSWIVWFDKKRYLTSLEDVAMKKRPVRTLGQAERILKRPMLVKNLRIDQWLLPVSKLFPRAVFIIVARNPEAVARSLLVGREKKLGDRTKWFSVRPPSLEKADDLSPEMQVVLQIQGILERLASDMDSVGPERFLCADYDDFCRYPEASARAIHEWLKKKGIHVPGKKELPAYFEISKGSDGSSDADGIADLVRRYVQCDYKKFPCTQLADVLKKE